jgi:anti-sigma factor RsiW
LGPHLDSALSEDDAEWVEEHLRECARCRDRQALLAAQAQAIRERLQSAPADFSGFADKVMARVREEKKLGAGEHLRVWGSEMWGAHRGAFAAASGLAAAACLALASLLSPPAAQEPGGTLLAEASLPQFEQLDFGSHDGAVLQLRNETAVIWLSEDHP